MTINQSDFLSWSLFELKADDVDALTTLSQASLLCPLSPQELDSTKYEIEAGRRIALSFKSHDRPTYIGLCVFSLESPSPAGDKGIALHVFSLERYPRRNDRVRITPPDAIADALLNELKRFCTTHGYTRIHCFVPVDPDSVALLVRHGFEPEGMSLATTDNKTISLSRHLAPSYTGDPYDGQHLLNWIAEQLRLDTTSYTETSCIASLRLDQLNSDLSNTALGDVQLPVHLQLNITDANPYLRVGVSESDNPDISTNVSFEDMSTLAGMRRLDMTLWPPPPDGASIAVEIRADLFERFRLDGPNVFFDSGSYGTLLESGIRNGSVPNIFFVDFATTATNPRLIGVANVNSVHRNTPDELWRHWGSISSWADISAFARYRAIKRKMTAIVFDDLRRVNRVGAGLPAIGHSWTYVPADQAYAIKRLL